jgi:hypothetical protein
MKAASTTLMSGAAKEIAVAALTKHLRKARALAPRIAAFVLPQTQRAIAVHARRQLAGGGAFGLIHGLGFSNYFKAILGREESLVKPLFAFNIGVEAGQIAIVTVVMTLGYILMNLLKLPKKYWTIPISVVGILVAAWLLTDR